MLSIVSDNPEIKFFIELDDLFLLKRKSKLYYDDATIILRVNEKSSSSFITKINQIKEDEVNEYYITLTDVHNKIYGFTRIIDILSIQNNEVIIRTFCSRIAEKVIKIWKKYYENGVKEYNCWAEIKQNEKQAWLELALYFGNYDDNKSKIEIDGNKIKSLNDFFCSIGEALNGKGGYFGRDLVGFDQCLRMFDEFGTGNLKTVVWNNHKKCKWKLKNNFNKIIETLEEFNIEVKLN